MMLDEYPSDQKVLEFRRPNSYSSSLFAGAVAGLAVDLTLYPLDTIKTRLQSQQGFKAAGGLSRIYAGVPAVTVGSAPSAALFFWSYEKTKNSLVNVMPHPTFAHMVSACVGELTACLIRVPTEVFKQRAQATPGISTFRLFVHSFMHDGFLGLYRGYWSTVSREIPFSFIEFPLWEFLKITWSNYQEKPVTPLQTAACGSIAGAIAAGMTTPLDVAKTRIMLSRKVTGERLTIRSVIMDIYRVKGAKGIFAGFWPRVVWMALGGFVFFGAYEKFLRIFNVMTPSDTVDHYSFLGWRQQFLETMSKFWGAILNDDEKLENAPKTFDDVLKESEETAEKRRLAIIAAARKKFEGRV